MGRTNFHSLLVSYTSLGKLPGTSFLRGGKAEFHPGFWVSVHGHSSCKVGQMVIQSVWKKAGGVRGFKGGLFPSEQPH